MEDEREKSGMPWWRVVLYGLAIGYVSSMILAVGMFMGTSMTRNEAVAYGHAAWTTDGFIWHATQCGCPGLGLPMLPEDWAIGVDETIRILGEKQAMLRARIERLEESGTLPVK